MSDDTENGMTLWQKVKSSAGWGLFLGLCDWVLASAIVRKLPGDAVVAIVLVQTALGAALGALRWKAAWWIKGPATGLTVNAPLAAGLRLLRPEWGGPLLIPLLLSGTAVGAVLAYLADHKK
jgi:hypothetical protein